MQKKEEQTVLSEWKDLPQQTENPAFAAEEMIVCTKCCADNPPTRLKCFYCTAELEINEAQSSFLRPNLRKLIKKLREVAPNAKFVDDYLQVRESLGNIWEIELKTDS